jgi:hypothetical protein
MIPWSELHLERIDNTEEVTVAALPLTPVE